MGTNNMSLGRVEARPTYQEELLIALDHGDHAHALERITADLNAGKSPSILSVLRPELLFCFAEVAQATLENIDTAGESAAAADVHHKTVVFNELLVEAQADDPSSIVALPKTTTSVSQLALTAELILSNRTGIADLLSTRKTLQYLGTFDPQHVGHRILVPSVIQHTGSNSHVLVHVMGSHPRKPDASPYRDRYSRSEERLLRSNLCDNRLVTQVDIPGNEGLGAREDLSQMELIARVAGDPVLRWTIGSDKLMLDGGIIGKGTQSEKIDKRFSDPRLHAYVLHRQFETLGEVEEAAGLITDRYGTAITIVPEIPYAGEPASSTRVKELRAAELNAEADKMELYELLG